MNNYFNSLVTVKNKDGTFENIIKERHIDDLPNGDLLIRVEYSSLNYKDALSASGYRGVTKTYPHTPGVDAAGVVVDSNNIEFPIDTSVIVTGFDLGQNTSGGFAEYIRVPSEWVVKCPAGLSTKEAMMLGTAGLTSGLAIDLIQKQYELEGSKVIVSGATGGVGSITVRLLSLIGAEVVAITGKNSEKFLLDLGAAEVINRTKFIESTKFPMNKGIFNAAIDVVGGKVLSCIISSMKPNGIITACGNVGGPKFETTVFPFILRANSLIGIDSANCSIEQRKLIWHYFSSEWKYNQMQTISNVVKLDGIIPEIKKILKGEQIGRILLKL